LERTVVVTIFLLLALPCPSQLVTSPDVLDKQWLDLQRATERSQLRKWEFESETASLDLTKEQLELSISRNVEQQLANGMPESMRRTLQKSWTNVYEKLGRRSFRKGELTAAWNGSVCAVKRSQHQIRYDGDEWSKQELEDYGVSDFRSSFEYLSRNVKGVVEGSAENGTERAFELVLGNKYCAVALANVPASKAVGRPELKSYDSSSGILNFETSTIIGKKRYPEFRIQVDAKTGLIWYIQHVAGVKSQPIGEFIFSKGTKGTIETAEWHNFQNDMSKKNVISYRLMSVSSDLGSMHDICSSLGPKGAKVLDHRLGVDRRVIYNLTDKIPDKKDIESLSQAQEEAERLSWKVARPNVPVIVLGAAAIIGGLILVFLGRRRKKNE